MSDGAKPGPGGWNRIHFVVDNLESEIARMRADGVEFRNDVVTGPGGAQVLICDPSGNLVELFQPATPTEAGEPPLLPAITTRTASRRTGTPPIPPQTTHP